MERIQSLIHKIKNQYESGVNSDDLLQTLEQMRLELIGRPEPVDHTRHTVAIMLPPGYKSPVRLHNTVITNAAVEEVTTQNTVDQVLGKTEGIEQAFVSVLNDSIAPENIPVSKSGISIYATELDPAKTISSGWSAPRPPIFPFLEEPAEKAITMEEEQFPVEELLKPGEKLAQEENEIVEKREKRDAHAPIHWNTVSETEMEANAEEPLIFELAIGEEEDNLVEEVKPAPPQPLPFKPTTIIPEGFLNMGSTRQQRQPELAIMVQQERVQEAVGVAPKPKDLNEILAGRVVAKKDPLARDAGSRALAETLGGTKIGDLRKAISINDRFRFIHALFRNDEVAFERAVKTINNFSVLQEAQYWIQRELVIKLGWNEEDELVKQFYHLVSRRFL